MGDIIFKAKKIFETSKDITWTAHDGDTRLSANGLVQKNGDEGEKLLKGAPAARPVTTKRVKIITIKSPLHDGLNASGTREMGYEFGQHYELEVTEFDGAISVEDYANIKWGCRYVTPDGVIVDEDFEPRGKKVRLTVSALTVCGCELIIYAYFSNRTGEGILKKWTHYRFKWFDRTKVVSETVDRKALPWKINQSATSLCGMACIAYLLAKEDPNGYERVVLKLHQEGIVSHRDYTIKAGNLLFDMNPLDPKCKYPSATMPYADWILLASLRSSESWLGYSGKAGEDFKAINWPGILVPLGKKLLGYNEAEIDYYKLNKSYIRDYFGSDEKLRILKEEIDRDFNNGYRICMMIDGDMMTNNSDYSWSDFSEYHWIVYEGGLQLLNASGNFETDLDKVTTVKFKEFTWGEDVQSSRTSGGISKKAFITNYYAYLKLK